MAEVPTTAPAAPESRNMNDGFLEQYGTTDGFTEVDPANQVAQGASGSATASDSGSDFHVTSNAERRAGKDFGARYEDFAGGADEAEASDETASASDETSGETSSASSAMLDAEDSYLSEYGESSGSEYDSFAGQSYAPGKNTYDV